MKICKNNLIRNLGHDNQFVLNREFQKAGCRIKMEIAWQIFEDVNQMNDTFQHIDLSCLDTNDAIIIAKQKITDLAYNTAEIYREDASFEHKILNIKCADDHLVIIEDQYGRQPLKNCVLEMIMNEMNVDSYYINTRRTILAKVDPNTIQNNNI